MVRFLSDLAASFFSRVVVEEEEELGTAMVESNDLSFVVDVFGSESAERDCSDSDFWGWSVRGG